MKDKIPNFFGFKYRANPHLQEYFFGITKKKHQKVKFWDLYWQ